jgi:hypothetical protein
MLERTTSKNSKELTLLQVSSTPILSTELEITSMFVFAFHQSDKNSETVSENSQLSLTSVLLIGSYLGLRRL